MNNKQGTTVGAFIELAIKAAGKTKREVASEIGYKRPNIVSMLCSGEIDLPFNRVAAVARAIEVDQNTLLFMLLREKHPDLHSLLVDLLGDRLFTQDEARFIDMVRATAGTTHDLAPTTDEEVAAFKAYCNLVKARIGTVAESDIETA